MRRFGPLMSGVVLRALPEKGPAWSAGAKPMLRVARVQRVDLAPLYQQYDQAEDVARGDAEPVHTGCRSGCSRYAVIDQQPADRQPPHRYMTCKARIFHGARKRGGRYLRVTWAQKDRRLVLMMNRVLIDVAHADHEARRGSVDLRGGTDTTWPAGASQRIN